ncbi:MAG TPA: cytochrome c3 family protein, partial [Verrucomicrobiae bacterium]|nr:cytochrome c3 family protein [Verrucomicrobiae bacterium]
LEASHAIARTEVARSVLPAAVFTHKPHLQTVTCVECHAKVSASEEASDLALDGIAKCASCHNWRGAPDGCQTCHRYHPAPQEASAGAPGPAGAGPS